MDPFTRLVRASQYPDAAVRARAARELGEAQASGTLDPLWQLLSDEYPEVREAALEALARLGDAALARACDTIRSPEPAPRDEAVQVLIRFGAAATPLVVPLLDFELSSQATLLAVAEVLGESGDPAAIGPLEALLDDWMAGPLVHRAMVRALGRIGVPAAESLARTLDHADAEVRVRALAAFLELGSPEFVAAICRRLGSEDQVPAELGSSGGLGTAGDLARNSLIRLGSVATDALRELLLSENEAVQARHRAAQALEAIGDPESIAALCSAFGVAEPTLAWYAMTSVEGLGHAALPGLVASLTTAEEKVPLAARLRLIEAGLASLPADTEFPDLASLSRQLSGTDWEPGALTQLLGHADPELQDAAVRIASRLANPDATWLLCRALEDPADPIRLAAIKLLSQVADAAAVSPACRALEDPLDEVRGYAAWTLARLRAPESVEALQPARQSSITVRTEVVHALRAIGTLNTVPVLCETLLDANRGVATAAGRFFEKPSAAVVLLLCELLGDAARRPAARAALRIARPGFQEAFAVLPDRDLGPALLYLEGMLETDYSLPPEDYEAGATLLGFIGSRDCEELLVRLARTHERAGAPTKAAITALGRLGAFKGLGLLCEEMTRPTVRDHLEDTLIATDHLGAIPALKSCLRHHPTDTYRYILIDRALKHLKETKGHLAAHPVVPSLPQRVRNLPWTANKPPE